MNQEGEEKESRMMRFYKQVLDTFVWIVDVLFMLMILAVLAISFTKSLVKLHIININTIEIEFLQFLVRDVVVLGNIGFAVFGYCLGVLTVDVVHRYNLKKHEKR